MCLSRGLCFGLSDVTFRPSWGHPLKMFTLVIACGVLHRRTGTWSTSNAGQTEHLNNGPCLLVTWLSWWHTFTKKYSKWNCGIIYGSTTYLGSPIFEAVSTHCITEAPFGPGGHQTICGTADDAGFCLISLAVTMSKMQWWLSFLFIPPLCRNMRIAINKMFQQNASELATFFIFHIAQLYIFPLWMPRFMSR